VARTRRWRRSTIWRLRSRLIVRVKRKTDYREELTGDIVDFDQFQRVLNRPGGFRDPGEPEEYCRGFQVFDKDMTGYIGVGQLRYSESGLADSK
jgi:Ca2+-binding EF-hand superfamily protein